MTSRHFHLAQPAAKMIERKLSPEGKKEKRIALERKHNTTAHRAPLSLSLSIFFLFRAPKPLLHRPVQNEVANLVLADGP